MGEPTVPGQLRPEVLSLGLAAIRTLNDHLSGAVYYDAQTLEAARDVFYNLGYPLWFPPEGGQEE